MSSPSCQRLRKAKPKWTYDDVAMRAWIVENGADTLAKRELDRAAIRKAFKIEGDGDETPWGPA